MIGSAADRYRDAASIARCARIAARVFERHSVDFATAHREGGWSNATWSAGGLVLRIAVEAGAKDILREVGLASVLPPEVGYPSIVETGVTEGHEWMLSKQVSGRNLGEIWPVLDWEARTSALCQMWARARAVHSVDVALAAAHTRQESPFYASSAAEAAGQLARLQEAGVLEPGQVTVLSHTLDRFWPALASAPHVLNHGDLCTENVLWRDGKVVALLDLEFAVLAPVELDLNELLKAVYAPYERPDPLPDPDGSGLEGMRRAVTEIAAATASSPGGEDRVLGYALLLDLWSMENWLSKWDGREPYVDWAPYRALTSLTDGAGGYLAPALARLGAA
ncbi:MAG: aminoglycoside phosphotransferase family protein [Chloroflexi bacterium]|nr:aminoglycoside phosphotransferase family protein [Chloroflexota bacterium]